MGHSAQPSGRPAGHPVGREGDDATGEPDIGPVVPSAPRPPHPVVAALDVGGTSIKAGLIGRDSSVHLEARRPTGAEQGPDAVVDRILNFAADLCASGPVVGIAVGVPGIVDGRAGMARYAANLGWRDVPLVALLQERTGLPVALGHDVRLGALAEARVGAGRTAESVYFVAVGTGIAAGLVENGVVNNGATGQAGEVGHLVVRPGGPLCGCGNHGCLEAIASASRIGRSYSAAIGTSASAKDVFEAVARGDVVAQAIWDDAIAALADALTAVCILQDPAMIVLGGGLSLAGDVLLRPLIAAMDTRFSFRTTPPIAVAELGDRAGLAGAGILAWEAVDTDVPDGTTRTNGASR